MNNDFKLIAGVVGGSLLLLVLAMVGFGRLAKSEGLGGTVKEIKGEERFVMVKGETKVTIVEFSDFQCPACRAAQGLVKQIEEKEGVKVVYRHFPLSNIHKNAQLAAEAAEAAFDQGKFWEYHDVLFAKQADWSEEKNPKEKFVVYAKELGLDDGRFEKALEERVFKQKVVSDYQEGLRLGLRGTPSFFVNGREVKIDKLLGEVESLLK